MQKKLEIILLTVIMLLTVATPASSQRLASSGVTHDVTPSAVDLRQWPPSSQADRRLSLGKHVLVGSLTGFVVTVGTTVALIRFSGCLCDITGFIPLIAIGTGVGGLTGAVVYAIRQSNAAPRQREEHR